MSSEKRNSLTPSWGALGVVATLAGAALFVRCGASRSPPPAASASSPAPSAELAPVERPAAAASSTPPLEAPPEPQIYAVAAVGDSLTDARSNGGKYLGYLKQKCPESRFDNYGKGGDMTNQMRKRFFRDVLPVTGTFKYTHLIVFGGVNDLYSDLTAGRTPERIGKDLGAMYRAAKERGMRVVAINVAPWGGFSKYYNESRARSTAVLNRWIDDQHAGGAVDHVIDAYSLLSCGKPEELCPELAAPYKDGLHFGPAGHEKLGEALFENVFKNCR